MMQSHDVPTPFVVLGAVVFVVLAFILKRKNEAGVPDVQHIPFVEPWKTYAEWAKENDSPVVSVKTTGRNAIVLNDLHCTTELFEKRWSNYSSRPERPLLRMMGRVDNVGLQRYGSNLKKCRKLIHDTLNSRQIDRKEVLERLIEEESVLLLRNLINAPGGQHEKLVQEFIASLIFKLTYGHVVDAEHIRLLEVTTKYTNESLVPGKWLVDSHPWLQYLPSWVPGIGFKKWASEARTQFKHLTERPFNKVKDEIRKGVAPSSFVRDNLIDYANEPSMESLIAGTAASFHSAGTDTIGATLLTFLLMMVVHPDIQKKAYDEIISVIGPDRLPTTSDCKSLPYLTAVMKEVHRFNPAVPMAVRAAENTDNYFGKPIPRGSWVFVNIWAMTHDEEEYENPHTFYPERFLDSEKGSRDPRDIVFGFARRRCPGMPLANLSLIVIYARLLAVFHIQPPRNEKGDFVVPEVKFSTGFTAPPKEFGCVFAPRSASLKELLLSR